MTDKAPGRTKTGHRMTLGGFILLAGAATVLVACRYVGGSAPGSPRLHTPTPPPVIALGAAGLVCYTMFFLVCEAALLVLAIVNIQDEKVHNKYRSLMLLVLYVFTFRYRRVLPAKFFADAGNAGIETAKRSAAAGRRKAGKHRQKACDTTMSRESPPTPASSSPPVTDEEIRAAFTLLLNRMATALGDKETAGRAVPHIPSHPHE
jgi:hypothetical protein